SSQRDLDVLIVREWTHPAGPRGRLRVFRAIIAAMTVEQRQLVARDGTRIGYQVAGPTNRPCVVLANGLGGTYIAFRYLYDALADYRVVCWDYRGLYSSEAPADPAANTIAHQVGDLIEILDHERIGDVVLAGWSMGVQVSFETMRHHAQR